MATEIPSRRFQYPNLELNTKQIRLLRLSSGSTNDRLSFSLECHDVKSASFVALSYTWDHYRLSDDPSSGLLHAEKETQSEIVLVQDEHFWITPSLFQFITAIASTKLRDRLFFVDQICINQADETEKAHQVSLMRDVFFEAEEVVAWLVPLIKLPDDALKSLSDEHEGQKFLKNPKSMSLMKRMVFKRFAKRVAKEFLLHLRSAYWSRQWVLQEVLLAKELSFQIGKFNFDWEVVINLFRYSWYKKLLLHFDFKDDAKLGAVELSGMRNDCLAILLHKQQNRNESGRYRRESINFVLNRLGCRDCTMQRDRIFDLLGLLNSKRIQVDYQMSLGRLYLEVLCSGLIDFDRKNSPRIDLGFGIQMFIYKSTFACGLDIRDPTVMLVTARLLSHFNVTCKQADELLPCIWTIAEYWYRGNKVPEVEGQLKIVLPKYRRLQEELRECKASGSQMSMYNWDDFERVPLSESHTYEEWLKIVDDLVPHLSVEEWYY